MTYATGAPSFEAIYRDLLQQALTEAGEEALQDAMKVIEQGLRARLAQSVLALLEHNYSADYNGRTVTIRVDFSALRGREAA